MCTKTMLVFEVFCFISLGLFGVPVSFYGNGKGREYHMEA